jgi:glycosyltransferase involved in cell wall biosynthesis
MMSQSILLVGNFLSSSVGTKAVGEELAAHLASSGYGVRTTSSRRRRAGRLLDMMGTVLRDRHHYEIAHIDVFSGAAFLFAEAVAGLLDVLGKPYVLTLHGGNLPAFAGRWPRRVERLLRRAAVVTTPSRYLLEQMRRYRNEIRLLPNAVEVKAYAFRLRDEVRPRFIWLRSFHRMYNPGLAVLALARLGDRWPDTQLTMIGPDKGDGSLEEVKRLATATSGQIRIALPGAVPKRDVAAWLASGDVFLNTTNVDNTPVSVVEAMAAGLCIISTSVGGIPYLLEHEHDALLVPPGDPGAMADAIQRLFDEPGLAARLSRNARAKAEQLDWSRILPKWEDLLGTLCRAASAS